MRCGADTWQANLRMLDGVSVSSGHVEKTSAARVSATSEA